MLSKPNYKENGIHFSGCNDDGALFPPPPPRAITQTQPPMKLTTCSRATIYAALRKTFPLYKTAGNLLSKTIGGSWSQGMQTVDSMKRL